MTAKPEYPIVSSDDLRVGQTFRYGWSGPWLTAPASTACPAWVEAKPAPIQVGDRVQWDSSEVTATVKHVGEYWLIVQVDDPHGAYEDAWEIHHAEPIGDDDQ